MLTVIDLYRGRINQREFFFLGMIMLILGFIVNNIMMRFSVNFMPLIAPMIMSVTEVILTIFTMHLYVRRLHDIGQTGWLAFLVVLFAWINIFLGICCFIALVVIPSTSSENQYGPKTPKDRSLQSAFFNT